MRAFPRPGFWKSDDVVAAFCWFPRMVININDYKSADNNDNDGNDGNDNYGNKYDWLTSCWRFILHHL